MLTQSDSRRNGFSPAVALFAAVFVAQSLLALEPSRTLTQYVHEAWGTEEGLPQATIRAILQTRDGYLWLGTEEGLARFDGVRFTVFNRSNVAAFRENHVLSLLEDRAGSLWVGTHGGGLTRLRNGTFTTFTKADGLPGNFVYSLHEDRERTLWIGVRGGVARFGGGRFAPFTAPSLVGGTIWSIYQDQSGGMWIGSDLHGLSRIEGGVPTTYTTAGGLPHDAIPVILLLRDGRVVIGTNGAGIFEWSDGRFVPFRATGTLPNGAIKALLEDRAGNLWIGTNAGLARMTNGVISTGAPGELGRSPINAIAEDREGNLWIGTSSAGLHRLRDGKVHTITSADGLPSDRIQTIFHDRQGGAWIGTRDGAARIAAGKITTYTTRDGLPNDSVRSLFQSSDGAMWLGTEMGGVIRMAGNGLRTTILDPDVPDNTIRAFAEQPGVGVWVGTNGGRLTLFTDGAPSRRIEPGAGLPRLFVRGMAAGPEGSLWIATDGNGLVHLVDGKLRKVYTERDGLSRDGLRSIHIDAEGTVWIGTDGGGLNRLRKGKFTVYGTRQGLFDDRVLQILEGDDGRLWLSSNNGISAVEKRSLDAYAEGKLGRVPSIFIDDHDGMISRNCSGGSQPAGAKDHDGRLWFPTNAGVVVVDPRRMQSNSQPPPVHIETVAAEHNPVAGNGSYQLPRGAKNLEIGYTALSFVVPKRVRFRYKLEGYDDDWIDAGTRRTAYYTALRPGHYRFRVVAANDDGLWNQRGATAEISLPPYFYQRRSFALLLMAAAAAAIWAGVTARIRHIRREAARAAEMERRLVVVQRMDSLGQMASGIAHDFNNTLMAAYPWAELIRRRYPHDSLLQRAGEQVMNAVDRAKRVTSQLLDFAQPKQPEITPVDLGELAREALSMARAVIPPEIDVRMMIDPRDIVATGDQAKIEQVLLNLVLNACDAMPNGGRLTVETRRLRPLEAASWDVERDEFVLLSVSDSGTGMEEAVLHRIFDPFYTTKDVGKGTGLGLAVVHRIVQDHHGAIHVDSAPGEGTTFYVLLPKGEGVQKPAQPAAVEDAPGALRGTKVLLVDDDAVIAEIIGHTLGSEGVEVEVSRTGTEALRRLETGFRPDVVILDLGLPEMTGDRVHALIRRQLPDLPIILSSGYGDRERLDPLLHDPRTSYLRKPYRMNALMHQIMVMTQRGRTSE